MKRWDWDRKFDGMKVSVGGPYVLATDVRSAVISHIEVAESLLSHKPRSVADIDAALIEIRRALNSEI